MALAITIPDTLEMLVGEQLTLSVDFTNVIAPGDVISSPTVTVTNSGTNESVTTIAIIGGLTITGNQVNVTVNSVFLRKSTNYIAVFTCVATGANTTKNVSALLNIKIIF